jgi:hypothetical protein
MNDWGGGFTSTVPVYQSPLMMRGCDSWDTNLLGYFQYSIPYLLANFSSEISKQTLLMAIPRRQTNVHNFCNKFILHQLVIWLNYQAF